MEVDRVKKKGGSKSKKKNKHKQKRSVANLLKQVEEKLDAFQYEEALGLCEEAIARDPSNVKALETAAPILLELGGEEKAYEYLRAAVQLCPDSGYSKYMYLGQMCSGDEAVAYITKGVELMTQLYAKGGEKAGEASSSSAVISEEVSAEKLSNGYCTLAEMFLTDCCFLPDAEQRCLECCTKAVSIAPQNPEAHQAMASYLLTKGDLEGAKESLVKCLELWLPHQGTPDAILPPYPARINCAKLLMELEEMEKASCILEHLLKEDDEGGRGVVPTGLAQLPQPGHDCSKILSYRS
eukprot:Em0004g202a